MQNGKKVLTLHDMSKKMCSFFLPLIWSIFLPLASVDRHRRRRRTLFLPLFLVLFGLNGFDQWVSGWMGLNVSRHRHHLPLEALILLLKVRRRFRCGFWSILLGLFFLFFVGGLCWFRCDTGVNCGCGSVAVWVKKWIFYLNKRVE